MSYPVETTLCQDITTTIYLVITQLKNVYLGLPDYPTLVPTLMLSWQPGMSILATHVAYK